MLKLLMTRSKKARKLLKKKKLSVDEQTKMSRATVNRRLIFFSILCGHWSNNVLLFPSRLGDNLRFCTPHYY